MSQIEFGDPGNGFIREVKPSDRQADFLSIPDSVFEALYGGAAYGGKSFILTLLPLIRGFYKFRGFKGIILRRKFPDLEREIIRLSKEYYPATGATYNEQKHSWEWKQYGSYLDFGHIQHSENVRQYDSAQYNYCAFDELTHFEQASYTYLVGSRVRPSSSFNIAISRNGTNPGGIGQTWVYNRFVKPNENGYSLIKDKKSGLYRIFIPAYYTDNPFGMQYDPRYGDKLEMLSEAEKRAKKYGDWHAFKGSVFTTFRPIQFPNEPENAIHVIDPFQIPNHWPRILAIDWGKHAMCYALWGAISPDRRVYAYRERSWIGEDIYKWASEIKEIHYAHSESPVVTVLCGSAWQNRGQGTIADEFQKYSGLAATSSENTPGSRVAGVQLIHDVLRWDQKKLIKYEGEEQYDSNQEQYLYRLYGRDAVVEYRKRFQDEQDRTLPVLQIFNNCKLLIETIPVCIYDETRTEDIAEFNGDDPIDCLRYFCKEAYRFINGEGFDNHSRRSSVIQEYETSGDINKFYRQMEKLDTPTVNIVASRRSRFSRRRNLGF